jgi:hypothetical protein
MIEFVVEDGTGKTDSTSYAEIADFRQYWENRGVDYSSTVDDTIKAWLNSATEYIDFNYVFKGVKTSTDQALEWPRTGVTDRYCNLVDSDIIPTEVIYSTCYLAAQVANGSLFNIGTNVKSDSYGPVSVTYSGEAGAKTYKAADQYLKWFTIPGSTLIRVN